MTPRRPRSLQTCLGACALVFLLLGPSSGSAQDAVDQTLAPVSAQTIQEQPAVAPSAAPSAAPTTHPALARARARELEQRARTNRLLLGLVGLLVLWLLARNALRQRSIAVEGQLSTRPRPRRRIALNHEELGHLVFEAARGRHHHDFRDLFLNGPEAAALLGRDDAQAYLDQRSELLLHNTLNELAESIDQGAIFLGVEPVGGGLLGLRVQYVGGKQGVWPVGSVTQIEGGCRLHLPASLCPQTDGAVS